MIFQFFVYAFVPDHVILWSTMTKLPQSVASRLSLAMSLGTQCIRLYYMYYLYYLYLYDALPCYKFDYQLFLIIFN